MRKFKTIPISSLSSLPNKRKVNIVGTILEVTVFPTNSSDEMAVAKIEDETGSIDVLVFPILYKQISNQLIVRATITIRGRIFQDPGAEAKVVAES